MIYETNDGKRALATMRPMDGGEKGGGPEPGDEWVAAHA